ncbi:Stk1 family PASTA domain-containing Ser/Thr kinase [Microbacterium gubbeenense]|uniref:Stk1 family PASTA domain-containing Ser/Thr kinase n=1 Tax=Microbacterium gubbeenense TaxID=159896 RepID=UPI003F99CB17
MSDEPTQAMSAPVQEERVLSGRYRVDSLIGKGGMASVYRGYDLTLGRTVAIKILSRELASDNTFRTRFRLEAQAASRMAHPSIVRVYDAGEDLDDDGMGGTTHTPFIVMELVRGRLLKDVIAQDSVSTDDAASYVDGILEALEFSHRAGVIHRDIKPANIMVTDDGHVKVMDFGIARAVSDTSATVAETTTILGTAAYFSPEQAKGEPVDLRADIYSTGVVLYELLTGRPPFIGDSPVSVAYQHVREAPIPPTKVVKTAPPQLDPVVMRALAKDPEQRFADAATFREELDAALDGKTMSRRQLAILTDELYGEGQQLHTENEHTLTQLSSDNGVTRTQSGPPVAWVWAAIVLLIALVAAVAFWVVKTDPLELRAADTVSVTDVSGWNEEAAVEELEGAGLKVRVVTDPSNEVAEGTAIETDPASGTSLTIGAPIEVHISGGPLMATIPELVGLSEDAARDAISGVEGLSLGKILPVNDAEAAAGAVLTAEVDGSAVAAGDEILQGATVDLTVATGRITVRNVEGLAIDAITSELEGMGLTVKIAEDSHCEATETPIVSKQDPAAGDVPIKSTVTLTKCTGEDSESGSEGSGSEGAEGSGSSDGPVNKADERR